MAELAKKAFDIPKNNKARAWDYFVGFKDRHIQSCNDDQCECCNAIAAAVEFALEEDPEGT